MAQAMSTQVTNAVIRQIKQSRNVDSVIIHANDAYYPDAVDGVEYVYRCDFCPADISDHDLDMLDTVDWERVTDTFRD